MKAAVCTRYGPPEVVELKEVARPVPKRNEMLVQIHATTVAAVDWRLRSFQVPLSFWLIGRLTLGLTGPRARILGTVLAGEVVSVGQAVKSFKPGDRVLAYPGHSARGHAEYRCVSETECAVSIPAEVSFEQAVSVPFGGMTALFFLRKADIKPGQKVLIYGASGSVGTFAVQLAKYLGAEVTAVCGPTNADLVRSLGADRVLDYTKDDFSSDEASYDAVFDAVGLASFAASLKALKEDGVLLHTVVAPALNLRMRLTSLTTRKRLLGGTAKPTKEALTYLLDLVRTRRIKPVIDRRYPLDQIVEAHRYVESRHKKGDVVIIVSHEHGA